MKFFTLAAALASVAVAAPSAAPSPLDVKIESAGNSGEVKATITNTGKDNLKIFKHGTIFDNAHTEKASIEANGKLEPNDVYPRRDKKSPLTRAAQATMSSSRVSVSVSARRT